MNSDVLDQFNLNVSHYGYSATSIDQLGASEYTLVTIVVDCSGSVSLFKSDLEKTIKEVVSACKLSPRSDNLMIRIITFSDDMSELHGFKLLSQCNPDDYTDCLSIGGCTALFSASENAIEACAAYGKTLTDNEFSVNGIVVIITDGMNNKSGTEKDVEKVLKKTVKSEVLESLLTILVGVGTQFDPAVSQYLDEFKNKAGLNQYVDIKDANSKTLAKLAKFISKSISAQSQSLGTGGPSQTLTF